MLNNKLALLLFSLWMFSSCQVKEATYGGGLISDHTSVTNKFTLLTPSSQTFGSGETVTLTIHFPFDIIVNTDGGSPRLSVDIGGSTYYANYVSRPTPRSLNFSYQIANGDNDTDGIDLNGLELNGSTLTFNNNGTITNCDTSTLGPQNLTGIKVDTTSPVISAFALMTIPGYYHVGEELLFSMTFSEPVNVSGAPKFTMNISTGGVVDVDYSSGSGTNTLLFTYTIQSTHADENGYNSFISPIDLNGGSIVDPAGNIAVLDFSSFSASVMSYSATVPFNGRIPFLVGVSLPESGTYLVNQELSFILEFDRSINVSGTPYLPITIGAHTRQASYHSGSGSRFLTFKYTTVPGDVDTDGISVGNSLVQNGGNISDTTTPFVSYFSSPLNNFFSPGNSTNILVQAIQPMPTEVVRNNDTTNSLATSNPDNVWIIGQTLNLTVTFNTGIYVDQTSGTPYIPITIGSTVKNASYLSGGNGQSSLVFTYTIEENDLDSDGSLNIGSIVTNGGVITDVNYTNSLLNLPVSSIATTFVDGVRPVISDIISPTGGVYSQVTPLNPAALSFRINWSEPVNFSSLGTGAAYLSLDIGGTAVRAEYGSGNNSAVTFHRPTSLSGRNDADGIGITSPLAGSATVRDVAGNAISDLTYTPPDTSGILVDTTSPTVSSISALTPNGTYRAGDDLEFLVTFSETVTTTVSGGRPRIPVTIGSFTRYLIPTADATSTSHVFRYTIVSSDLDTNGIVLGNSIQNSTTGHVRDNGRNNVAGTFIPPDTSLILVDAVAPSVSTTTAPSSRSYVSGETLSIELTFSEVVYVNTDGGTPFIPVDFAYGTDDFSYSSGSGSTTLIFSRTLTSTHFDMDGLNSTVNTIDLNGATIKDAVGNNASTNFSSVNLSQIYVTYPEVKLWVMNDFVNRAPPGGATISTTGTASYETCGTGTCRTFDGDDSLSLSSTLSSVDHLFIVYKTPPAVGIIASTELFGNDLTLEEDLISEKFDLSSAHAEIIDNGSSTSGVNHDLDQAVSSTRVLQVNFTTSQSQDAVLVGGDFSGAIGEYLAIVGTLTVTEEENIRNYLNNKY